MKIGLSLHPRILLDRPYSEASRKLLDTFGGSEGLLAFLTGYGVNHIELRTVLPADDPVETLAIAERLWARGICVTVHGAMPAREVPVETPFETLYPSLLPLLAAVRARGERLCLTLHATNSKTDPDLAALARRTRERLATLASDGERLGFRIALEVDRAKEGSFDPGATCEGILGMIEGFDPETVGSNFDFGHFYTNSIGVDHDPSRLPPTEFLARCIHTHIHARKTATHFPLAEDTALPLAEYLSVLIGAGYRGVFNLELDYERWPERDFREALRDSILRLEAAVRAATPKFEEERAALAEALDAAYPAALARMAEELYDPSPRYDDSFYLFNASGMIFRTGGQLFAVDPCIRSHPAQDAAEEASLRVLAGVPNIFISHYHVDHFDPRFMKKLAGLPCHWYLPEFIYEGWIEEVGFRPEQYTFIHEGDVIDLPGLRAEVLPGAHFEPDGKGVPAVMFRFFVGGRQIFLPGDVRHFDRDLLPQFANPDVMFANVWLGRDVSQCTPDERYEQFCDFVAAYKPKKVYLGHLMEYVRKPKDIWSWEHAGRVMDGLTARLPGVPVLPLEIFARHAL